MATIAPNPACIRYVVNDRDSWWDVQEEQHDADSGWLWTGNVWACDDLQQAEQVAARLRCGEEPWGNGEIAVTIDLVAEEAYYRRVALAGDWDDDFPLI